MSFGTSLGAATISLAIAVAGEAPKLDWPAGGTPVRQLGVIADAGNVHPVRPAGVAVDSDERVFVADPIEGAVLVYDKQGTAKRWTGNEHFPLKGPVDVAVDGAGRIFVADGFEPKVVVFSAVGVAEAAFGAGVLKRPSAIEIDRANGRVWVADTRQNLLFSFDLTTHEPGKTLGGTEATGFVSPASLAVNSRGQLYVSDRLFCSIQTVDASGAPMKPFDVECGGKTEDSWANLVAVDAADRVYVVRPEDDSLQIFSAEGKPLQYEERLGTAGSKPHTRSGLAVSPQGRIYIVEQEEGTGRVRIYAGGPAARAPGQRRGTAPSRQ